VIRPALEAGSDVVADRFIDSSLAYQGVARGLGIDEVLAANKLAMGGIQPDRTLLLTLPPETAGARRDAEPDRIEAEDGAFHGRVADGFAQAAARFPERIRVVDGSGTPDEVLARVREAILT